MKRIFIAFIFSVSLLSQAQTTKEMPNARSLFKKTMKQLKTKAIKKSFLPIPIIFTPFSIPTWRQFSDCRNIYLYFKSAHILVNKDQFERDIIKKAEKRLRKLLRRLKEDTKEDKGKIRSFTEREIKLQAELDERVLKLEIKELAVILSNADKIIPKVLYKPNTDIAKHDLKLFRFSLRTISSLQEYAHKSIFEASVIREIKEVKNQGIN